MWNNLLPVCNNLLTVWSNLLPVCLNLLPVWKKLLPVWSNVLPGCNYLLPVWNKLLPVGKKITSCVQKLSVLFLVYLLSEMTNIDFIYIFVAYFRVAMLVILLSNFMLFL